MKRKNTTTACRPCRQRRAKCDGHKPRCSRCRDRALQCVYSVEGDGRRPASKSHVELLRSRIELLERTLRAHSIDVESSLTGVADARNDPLPQQLNAEPLTTAEISGSLCRDSVTNFDQDGEARYFGLSSGRLEFKPNAGPASRPQPDTTRFRLTSLYDEVVHEQVISEEIENELIDTYFKWDQPHFQVVDEKLFRDSRASKGKYFSPLLLNCILALASRYSLRLEVRADQADPNTAGQIFLEKAEVLLPFDMKSPNLTTLQSFCILGNLYVAIGADAAGWLYLGMANRLALDMGLNLGSPSVTPSGWLSTEEAELRKRIHWTLYCMDKTASMYTGRVCTLLDSQAQVCLPEIPSSESSDNVPPYQLRRSILGNIQRSLISLCRIIEKILLALYTPKSSIQPRQVATFLSSTLLELKNWHYDLPKELGLESNGILQTEPSVYVHHMIYHTAFILLMKPTLLRSQDKHSRKISYQAALEICNIGQKYRKKFSSFRQCPLTATYCTLSAVLTLLNAAHHSWEGISTANKNKNIELGLRVLEELSNSWNPAKRIWQNLQKMYTTSRKSAGVEPSKPPDQTAPSTRQYSSERSSSGGLILNTEKPREDSFFTSAEPNAVEAGTSPLVLDNYQMPSLDAFGDWPFDCIPAETSILPDPDFLGALHNFSYMETNPVFQFDSLPDDYSSFDILNRIQVHNMERQE